MLSNCFVQILHVKYRNQFLNNGKKCPFFLFFLMALRFDLAEWQVTPAVVSPEFKPQC